MYDRKYLYVLDTDSINLSNLDNLKWFNCNLSEYNHTDISSMRKSTIKYYTYDDLSDEDTNKILNITYPYNLYQIFTNFYDAPQRLLLCY